MRSDVDGVEEKIRRGEDSFPEEDSHNNTCFCCGKNCNARLQAHSFCEADHRFTLRSRMLQLIISTAVLP